MPRDAHGRVIRIIDPQTPTAGVTVYDYNGLDQLTAVTDAESVTTTYAPDAFGGVREEGSPDAGTQTRHYDGAGNVIDETNGHGIFIQYAYDARHRLTEITYPTASENVTLTYDEVAKNGIGFLTTRTDASGRTAFHYDPFGRLVQEVHDIDGVTLSTGYTYGDDDRLETLTYPNGETVTYEYDADRFLSRVLWSGGTATPVVLAENLVHLPFGPAASFDLGNGLTQTTVYDTAYRMSRQQVGTTPTTPGHVLDLEYGFDPSGNITTITDHNAASRTQRFVDGYDALDRLTEASGVYGDRGYTYDLVGNCITMTYDEGPYEPEVGAVNHVYRYNDAGRLTTVEQGPNPLGRYRYNAANQRVKKTVNGVATRFVYDHGGRLIAEHHDSGRVVSYVYLGDRLLATAVTEGGATEILYVHTDHLGTPKRLTDDTGTVVWAAEHAPFGRAVVDDNPDGDATTVTFNVRFPGQYFDSETGLHYNYHRYYDPSSGRYLRSDPIGLEGGINAYVYGDGNPVVNIDIFGLRTSAPPPFRSPLHRGLPVRPSHHHFPPIGRPVANVFNGPAPPNPYVFLPEPEIPDDAYWGRHAIVTRDGIVLACNADSGSNCRELLMEMYRVVYVKRLSPGSGMSGIQERYQKQLKDPGDLCRQNPTAWREHNMKITEQQRRLRKLMDRARRLGCVIPDEFYAWLILTPPTSPCR